VILVAVVLLGGVVLLLMFNTSMQQASFKATRLEEQATLLNAKKQQLRMELDTLRDPQRVSEAAARLGMVPITTPAFLRLSDGSVLGVAQPASGDTRIRLKALPPAMPDSFKVKPEVVYAPVENGQVQAQSEGTGAPGLLPARHKARSGQQGH
jgi:type II secretory pathway pseudopilin PulG